MAKPIVIFTNLFTLKARDVKLNKYIDMYYVWLFHIIKYAKLKSNDYCVTFIDEDTAEHISKSNTFQWLLSQLPNFRIIAYKKPVSIKDGIMKRYDIDEIFAASSAVSNMNPYYLHLDIDVLVIKDIRGLFIDDIQNEKPTLYLKKEGQLLNDDYYGELVTEEDKLILTKNGLLNMPGFTAGIFGWNKSDNFQDFIQFIKEKAKNNEKELYTVEQPFFNAAVFHYLFKKQGVFNFAIFENELTGHNQFSTQVSDKTVLLNFCGIPGDDSFHWDKILLEIMLSSLKK